MTMITSAIYVPKCVIWRCKFKQSRITCVRLSMRWAFLEVKDLIIVQNLNPMVGHRPIWAGPRLLPTGATRRHVDPAPRLQRTWAVSQRYWALPVLTHHRRTLPKNFVQLCLKPCTMRLTTSTGVHQISGWPVWRWSVRTSCTWC